MEFVLGIAGFVIPCLVIHRLGGPIVKGDDHGYRPDLAGVHHKPIVYRQPSVVASAVLVDRQYPQVK